MDCDSAKECVKQNECVLKTPQLTIKHVDKFLRTKDFCSTKLVFLKSEKEYVFNYLHVKTIQQTNNNECNVCFTKDGDYFYIYRNLIKDIILLNKNNKEAIVGHHFTIGYKNGKFEIHDTYYETKKMNDVIYFTKNIHRSFYKFYENLNVIKLKEEYHGNNINYEEDNQILWNDLRCYYKKLNGGAPKLKLSIPKKPKQKAKKTKIEYREDPIFKTSKEFADKIIENLKVAYATKHNNMLIKIPYIPDTIQVRVIKIILKHVKTKNNRVIMIIDKDGSYISINLL